MRLLDDRVGALPMGTACKIVYMAEVVHREYPEVRDAGIRHLREEVVGFLTGGDADAVTVETFTPEDLAAGWRTHAPMSPPPPATLYALVGYLTPNREDAP